MDKDPKVGVGVLIFKEGKILLGKRKGAHGEGLFCGPGGHLDFGETLEECAVRETKEESGLDIKNIRVVSLINLLKHKDEGKHYIDIGVVADWASGEPTVLELDKRESWDWFDPEDIPEPVWDMVPLYLNSLKTGRIYNGTII